LLSNDKAIHRDRQRFPRYHRSEGEEKLRVSIEEEKLIINEMQKYDKLKTEFFSNISHELRTPINVIFCAVQLMEMNLNDSRALSMKH
jgi:signal transduction histidine kinase